MKKLLYLLILLFIIPSASAGLILNGPTESKYNIGDKIAITGSIMPDQEFMGYIQLNVACEDTNFPFQLVPLNLNKGEQKLFPSEIPVPEISVTSGMTGACKIKATLMQDENILETAESKEFIITKELKGNFNIDKTRVPAGSAITITGTITKLNEEPISGSAEIYLTHNKTKYFVKTVYLEEGILDLRHVTRATPNGEYEIDIMARDLYGNEMLFQNALAFTLVRDLIISAEIDKDEVEPGDEVEVKGEVKNVLQNYLDKIKVIIKLEDKEYLTRTDEGKFGQDINIPDTIKSGNHFLTITAEDESGNIGVVSKTLNVAIILKRIDNELSTFSIKPGEQIEIIPTVYDQASEPAQGEITLKIIDPKSKVISTKEVQSAQKIIHTFSDMALPGRWEIVSEIGKLESKDIVIVEEVEKFEAEIRNQIAHLMNKGNIDYKDEIRLRFLSEEGNEYSLKSSKTIKPNDTRFINLKEELPTGMYNAEIHTKEGVKDLGTVNIIGGKKLLKFKGLTTLLIIAIIIIVLIILLFGREQGAEFRRKMKSVLLKKDKPKRYFHNIKPKKKEKKEKDDVKDFRDRMLASARKTEERFKKAKK